MYIYMHMNVHTSSFHCNTPQRTATYCSTLPAIFASKTISIYIYMYIHIHILIQIYTYIHTYVYTHINKYRYIQTYIYINLYLYIYIYICLYLWCSRERTACSSSIWAAISLSSFGVHRCFRHVPVSKKMHCVESVSSVIV